MLRKICGEEGRVKMGSFKGGDKRNQQDEKIIITENPLIEKRSRRHE
jgi:hypothetical protein